MRNNIILATLLAVAISVVWAADSPKKSAGVSPQKVKPTELRAWAEEVKGAARYGVIESGKTVWKKIEKGHEFKPQQFIRTGLGDSYVLVKLSNGCYTEVKASTKIGISTLFKEGGTVHHNIALKYGSIKAKVEASKGENDFTVTTPRGTLSARGSLVGLAFAGDRGLGARGYSGTWHAVATQTGLHQNIQRGQSYTNHNTLASVLASQHRDVRLGDPLGGLSNAERQNLIDNGGGRGVFNFDGGTNNGSGSFTDTAPGQLTIYWTGSGTFYSFGDESGMATLYGTGTWTRGEKSGGWEGSGTTASDFFHGDGAWNGDIVDASGNYKTLDSSNVVTERGTWSGIANGSGTYVDDPPTNTGGETTESNTGKWQGGGTFSGTTTVTYTTENTLVNGGYSETTGGGMTTAP